MLPPAPTFVSREPFMVAAPEGESPWRGLAFVGGSDELCVAAGSVLYRFDREGRCLAAHRLPWALPHRGALRGGGRRLLAVGASRAIVVDVDSGALLESHDEVIAALSDTGETLACGPHLPRPDARRLAMWKVGAPQTRYPPPGSGMGRPLWVDDERTVLAEVFDRVDLYGFRRDVWTTVAERIGRGSGGAWHASTDGRLVAYATSSQFMLFSVEERRLLGVHRSSMTSHAMGPQGLVAGSDHRGRIFLLRPGADRLERHIVGTMPGGATALAFSPDGRRLAAATWAEPRAVILSVD